MRCLEGCPAGLQLGRSQRTQLLHKLCPRVRSIAVKIQLDAPARIPHNNSIGIADPFHGGDCGNRSCVGAEDALVSKLFGSYRQLITAGEGDRIHRSQKPGAPETAQANSRRQRITKGSIEVQGGANN